ncbi:SDR family oxidoreductase [Acidihalobacter prosperus]
MPSIVITGTNRGIGLSLARSYKDDGWRVYACCRHESPELEALADDHFSIHQLDVSDSNQINQFARQMENTPIDVLFNNAGVYGPSHNQIGSLDMQGLSETVRINALGPLLLAQALLPNLKAGNEKIIATLSSRMGSIGDNNSGGHYPYRISKAGLNAGMKSLAVDLRSYGIKVLVLHPGWVRTDMGGVNGELSTDESAMRLIRLVSSAKEEDSGRFLDVYANTLPW